jgi:HK97 family phage major capsid protein
MAIETTSGNAALIQSQVQQLLISPLEQTSSFLASGVTLIDSNSPVRIPRVSSGATAGFVAEGQLIGDADVAFDEVTALPSTLKSIKVWLPVSNELIRSSAVTGLSTVLQNRLVTDTAKALDSSLYAGSGSANTIKGVVNQTGVQTAELDTTDLDSLLDAVALAHAENVTPNRWYMNPQDYIALRKIHKGTGDKSYVVDPDVHADTQYSLFGIPLTVTNHLALGKAVLADTTQLVVVRDTDASVFIADQTLANYDALAIRVTLRMDLAVTQPKAVVVLTDTP